MSEDKSEDKKDKPLDDVGRRDEAMRDDGTGGPSGDIGLRDGAKRDDGTGGPLADAERMDGVGEEQRGSRPRLTHRLLGEEDLAAYNRMKTYPVKMLQIGEGNFLRGFVDWMIHRCNRQGLFHGSVVVTQPRPSGAAKLRELSEQDGLYQQRLRGLRDGQLVDECEMVGVFSRFIDPYSEWETFLALAAEPSLEFVVSNTTEAGLVYQASEWAPDEPVASYPGKLTVLLYRRFAAFGGDPDKGLVMLPCELVERGGDKLREIVLQHATDWRLPQPFLEWVENSNTFLNSLVDRIVTGYPADGADGAWVVPGAEDRLLNVAEPYHLWVIEAGPEMAARLPFAEAGLNVLWTDDLEPYRVRKVRVLNGAHTLMAAVGLLQGLNEVRQAVEHPQVGSIVRRALLEEIVPFLPLPEEEKQQYVAEVLERFANPYVQHKLTDIAMNSVSKFATRLLPSLDTYVREKGTVPPHIVGGLAALVRLYRGTRTEAGGYQGSRLNGEVLELRDSPEALAVFAGWWGRVERGEWNLEDLTMAVLSQSQWWGRDLNQVAGLGQTLAEALTGLCGGLS